MPAETEQISCPRNPDHGMVTERWLPPEEREMITEGEGDVYEIDCELCGRYEYRVNKVAE